MKKSPKTVKIDLVYQSQKRSKSPSPNHSKSSLNKPSSHQFSFSHQDSPFLQSKSKEKQESYIARKLFKNSPEKIKSKKKSSQKYKSPKKDQKQYFPHQYHSDKSQKFIVKKSRQQDLLKSPMYKLKRTFFNSIKNNKEQTIRTLKQIGKYAENRSKEKINKDNFQKENSQKRKKPINVQFYGFDPLDYRPYSPSKHRNIQTQQMKQDYRNRQQDKYKASSVDVGTYFHFQNQVSKHLAENDLVYSRAGIDNPKIKYSPLPQKHLTTQQSPAMVSGIENINEIQIDAICQIFEMCEKYDQGEKLVLSQFYMLLEQFERLYFIKIIQQSEANGLSKQKIKINEGDFYELLKRFEQNFKIVFYRRQACDIYDCLYYLKESFRLDKVSSLFLGLKKILNL